MANTVSLLSYANTFGDWVVATNSLATENNSLAANNYVKSTGTLYLNDPSLGLQVANNAIVAGQLQVQGTGSSAFIQNNLRVSGQIYFTNTSLGLTNAGQANIGGPLYALSTGTGLIVANNTTMGGTINVTGAGTFGNNVTITGNTAIGGFLRVTSNTTLANSVLITGNTWIANTLVATGASLIANNFVVSGNTNIESYLIVRYDGNFSNNILVTGNTYTGGNNYITGSSYTTGSAYVANNSIVNLTSYTNYLQANSTVNTATASIVGTTFTDVLQANTSTNTTTSSVTGTSFTKVLQANTSTNTATASVTGTTFTNVLQANSTVNTATVSATNTIFARNLQANNSVNTAILSVTGTEYVDTVAANTLVSAPKVTVNNILDANTAAGFFSSIQTSGQVSVGGNFVISGATVYSTNTFTLNAGSGTGQISYFNVNRGGSGANASIRWNETSRYWDILDVNTGGSYSKILTANLISDSIVSTSSSTLASSAAANTLQNNITTANNNLKLYTDSNLSANVATINSNITSNVNTLNTNFNNSLTANVNSLNSTISLLNTYASSAYNKANTGGVFSGDVTVSGNLVVNGTTTTISQSTIAIGDSLIKLANNNTSDTVDIGFYGQYNSSGTKYAGLFRKAADKFYLTAGLTTDPTGNTVTFTTANRATLDTNITGGTVSGLSADIAIADGGTNASTIGSAGSLAFSNGSAYSFTSVGTAGQVPTSAGSGTPTWTTATNLNTASAIVQRDASGNFSAGTITATLSGNASSASQVNNSLTAGSYLVGTAFNGSAAQTWSVNATNNNTGSTVVARDASGNFSAGTITASLSGTATTATNWGAYGGVPTAGSIPGANGIPRADSSGYMYFNYINISTSNGENPTVGQVLVTNGTDGFVRKSSISSFTSAVQSAASGTWAINVSGNSATTSQTNFSNLSIGGSQVLYAGNYNSYAPSLTGGNASGTWGINISGTAATATNVSGGTVSASTGSFSGAVTMDGYRMVRYDGYCSIANVTNTNGTRILNQALNSQLWICDNSGNTTAAGNVTAYSDMRLKTNVKTIENALDKTCKLRGVTFEKDGVAGLGVIAQEVREIIPEVVVEHNDDQRTLSVAYGNIVGLLIESIKELKAEIDELKRNR